MPDLVSRAVCSKYSHCIAYKPEPHKSPYVCQAPLLLFLCSELLSSVPLTVSPLCMAIFVPDPRRDPPFQSHQSLLLKKYPPFKIQGPSSAALDGFLVSSGYWKVAVVIALSCSALPSFACWRHWGEGGLPTASLGHFANHSHEAIRFVPFTAHQQVFLIAILEKKQTLSTAALEWKKLRQPVNK